MALLEGTSEMEKDDDARFEAVYARCEKPLLSYLLRRVAYADARDIAAETLLVVWRRLDEVPSDPVPWVLAVARNQVRNSERGRRRRRALLERVRAGAPQEGEDTASAPADSSYLEEALATLSETDREVLLLVGWDGLDAAEGAAVVGCSVGTFRVRLHRARRHLAERLDQATGSDDGDRS